MAKYIVIESFSDLKDNEHIYRPGDVFPREGHDVSIDRLVSLAGRDNKIGKPLIQLINNDPTAEDETEVSDPAFDADEPEDSEEQPKTKRSRRSKKQ